MKRLMCIMLLAISAFSVLQSQVRAPFRRTAAAPAEIAIVDTATWRNLGTNYSGFPYTCSASGVYTFIHLNSTDASGNRIGDSVKFGTTSFTFIDTINTVGAGVNHWSEIWGLSSTPSGTDSIRIWATGISSAINVNVISFSGVGSLGNVAENSTLSVEGTRVLTTTVSSAIGELVVGFHAHESVSLLYEGAGETVRIAGTLVGYYYQLSITTKTGETSTSMVQGDEGSNRYRHTKLICLRKP